jgi:hypothetical protein
VSVIDDAAIRDLVVCLAAAPVRREGDRASGAPCRSGASADVVDWIVGRAGHGETVSAGRSGGLHGGRIAGTGRTDGPPLRYILPAGALD